MSTVFNAFTGLPDFVGTSAGAAFTSIAILDSLNIRWVMTIDTGGHLVTNPKASGPAGCVQFNQLVMKDEVGSFWTVTVTTNGNLDPIPGGNTNQSIDRFLMVDSNGIAWVVTILSLGNLDTN